MEDNILLKDKLSSEEKIQYVLDQQEKGLTRKQIRENMGYKKTGSLTDLMKRYGYAVVGDKFVEGGEEHPHATQDLIVGSVNAAAIPQDTEMQEKLLNMIDKYDQFIEVLDWYESGRGQRGGTSNIVEVVTGLQIDYPETKTMKTSIRIDADVWEKFKELGDGKYKHISNAKLISQAIHEFILRYE